MSAGMFMFALQGLSQIYGFANEQSRHKKQNELNQQSFNLSMKGIREEEKQGRETHRQRLADLNVREVEERESAREMKFQNALRFMQAEAAQHARQTMSKVSGNTVQALKKDLWRQNLNNVTKINNYVAKVRGQIGKTRVRQKLSSKWFHQGIAYKKETARFQYKQAQFRNPPPDPMALMFGMAGAGMQGYMMDFKLGDTSAWEDDPNTGWIDSQDWSWASMPSWGDETTSPYQTGFKGPSGGSSTSGPSGMLQYRSRPKGSSVFTWDWR